MPSIKATIAIALTLIISMPILMGFALASDEQTTTGWEATSTTNATDLTLNSTSPYFSEYVGPQNNAQIFQKQHFTLQNIDEWHMVAPDYVSTSENESTLPVPTLTTVSTTLNTLTPDTGSYYMMQPGEKYGTSADYTYTFTHADKPLYYYQVTSTYSGLHRALICDGTQVQAGPYLVWAMRDSDTTWTLYSIDQNNDTLVKTGVTDWYLMGDAVFQIIPFYQDAKTIVSDDKYVFSTDGPTSVTINYSNSSTGYAAVTGTTNITLDTNGIASIGGNEYTGVASLGIATGTTNEIVYYDTYTYAGQYADASEGWRLPLVSGAATYNWWTNNQLNEEVRIMVEFTTTSTTVFMSTDTSPTTGNLLRLVYGQGGHIEVTDLVSHTSTSLGLYSKVMVVIDLETVTVYGISDWPTLGIYPTTYNEVSFDRAAAVDPFNYVYIQDATSNTALFRVDYCEAVAGYFPSTKNITLPFSSKYPGQSLEYTIKSVGKYGSLLGLGGTNFTVTDGKISGTDADGNAFTTALRGATIRYIYNSANNYTISINGYEVTGHLGGLYFGGEWSFTSSISLLAQKTSTQQVWAPGEFAFDKEDFAACGLLVAGICMVGLGMTGNRSGAKMGALLIVCGGAGLIYLTIL